MGNGIGTALANRVAAHLGGVADEVSVARVDTFDALALVTSGDPYTMDQATQDAAQRNPRWVPEISSATSASIGAHVGTHAAAEAARVVFRFGLWPAALELWGIAPTDPKGQAVGGGALARRAARSCPGWRRWRCRHRGKGACAQLRDRRRWRTAFPAGPGRKRPSRSAERHGRRRSMRWPCARVPASSRVLDRTSVKFPPTEFNRFGTAYTSLCGTLVRVEIERATGALRIAKAYSVLECGRGAGAAGRAGAGAGRLRDGRWLCVARVVAAL